MKEADPWYDSEYMKATGRVSVAPLLAEIRKSRRVLGRIEAYHDEYLRKMVESTAPSRENRIVIAEILVNYYTCLETIFRRVSQFFENERSTERRHYDLLDNMTVDVEGVRPNLLSERSYAALREIMRFRRYKRYHLEFDYDWDKLQALSRTLESVRPQVREDLDQFEARLRQTQK